MIQPVGFEELQSLQNPIAGRLHEILMVKFTDPKIRSEKSWTVSYTELCNLLPIRAVGWMSSPQRQFEDIHNELIGYDILDRIEWQKTDQGWTVQYFPGVVLQELSPPVLMDDISTDLHEGVEPDAPVDPIAPETDVFEEMVDDLNAGEHQAETEPTTEQGLDQINHIDSYDDEEIDAAEDETVQDHVESVEDDTYVTAGDETDQGTYTEAEGRLEDLPAAFEATLDEGAPEREDEAPEDTVEDPYFSEPDHVIDDSAAESDETWSEVIEEDTVSYQDTAPAEVDTVNTITASGSEVEVLPDTSYVLSPLPNMLSFEGGITMSQNGDTLCNIQYLLAWTTRSRDQVLNDDVALRTRSLIREICAIHEARITRGVVAPDYVQIEVVCPPTLTPAALVNDLKERTLNALHEQFPDLQQQYWGLPLWSSGYMCVTTGADAETQLNQYLDAKRPADDESFQVIPAP